MLKNIRIVLINTSHPGNIGAVARAMKTMGLSNLCLVAPKEFPHPKSWEMASGAGDVLDNAQVVATFEEAIADCQLVVGTSARMRSLPWPLLMPRQMAERLQREHSQDQIALVFGREQSGLTNEELQRCHFCTQIPANEEYSSLNIAAAAQVLAYELRVASLATIEKVMAEEDHVPVSAEEMERFFVHLEQVLMEIDFLKASTPKKLMARLRRLFFRARPDQVEINILRGILTGINRKK